MFVPLEQGSSESLAVGVGMMLYLSTFLCMKLDARTWPVQYFVVEEMASKGADKVETWSTACHRGSTWS